MSAFVGPCIVHWPGTAGEMRPLWSARSLVRSSSRQQEFPGEFIHQDSLHFEDSHQGFLPFKSLILNLNNVPLFPGQKIFYLNMHLFFSPNFVSISYLFILRIFLFLFFDRDYSFFSLAQAGLELMVMLLPSPPKCQDLRCEPRYLASSLRASHQ